MHFINDGFDIVEVPVFLYEAMNLTEIQRLDEVSQLGLTKKVFPSASHTRKAHVTGTATLALKIAQHLELPEDELKTVVLAALFHDIGHGPLSHASEKIVAAITGLSHEQIGAQYVLGKLKLNKPGAGKIPELLKKYNVNAQLVADIICLKEKVFAQKYPDKYHLKQIISSNTDADRMDYLRRDAHTANVDIRFSIQRLISYMRLAEYEGKKVIAFEKVALRDLASFFRGRMYMYNQVYIHPTVSCMERMYVEALRYALDTIRSKGVEFFMLNDVEVVKLLEQSGDVAKEIIDILYYKRDEVYTTAFGLIADEVYPGEENYAKYERLLKIKERHAHATTLGETVIEAEIVKRANKYLQRPLRRHEILVNFSYIAKNKEKAIKRIDVPVLIDNTVVMVKDFVKKNKVVDVMVEDAMAMPTKFMFAVYTKRDKNIIEVVRKATKEMMNEL